MPPQFPGTSPSAAGSFMLATLHPPPYQYSETSEPSSFSCTLAVLQSKDSRVALAIDSSALKNFENGIETTRHESFSRIRPRHSCTTALARSESRISYDSCTSFGCFGWCRALSL